MEALAAIGLASNIVSFIDVAVQVIATAKEIHESSTGALDSDKELRSIADNLKARAWQLDPGPTSSTIGIESEKLRGLSLRCRKLADDLLKFLDKFTSDRPPSKVQSSKIAFNRAWRARERTELEQRLNLFSAELDRYITAAFQSEIRQHLQNIKDKGTSASDDLHHLKRVVDSLSQGVTVTSFASEATKQLREILQLSEDVIFRSRCARVLATLEFDGMTRRYHEVEEAHETTFQWIFGESTTQHADFSSNDAVEDRSPASSLGLAPDLVGRDEDASLSTVKDPELSESMTMASHDFGEWLAGDHNVFHIVGKPGAGKSTLMKFLFEHSETEAKLERWAGGMKLVRAQFFFWRPGQTLQHSMEGLKQSLLYSVLRQCPELIPKLCEKRFRETASLAFAHPMPKMELDEISAAFVNLMGTPQVFETHRFVFFIDGLDEFESHGHRQTHNTLVQQILRWCSFHPGKLTICVSSREEPAFEDGFSEHLRLRLQDLTRQDIRRTVSDCFEQNEYANRLQVEERHISALASDIVRKSEGVFLWVTLVLRNIEIGVTNGDDLEDLKNSLSVLPVELGGLIQELIARMLKRQYGLRLIDLVAELQSAPGMHWAQSLPMLWFTEAMINGRCLTSVEEIHSRQMEPLDRLCLIRKELHSLSSRLRSRCAGLLTIEREERNPVDSYLNEGFCSEDVLQAFSRQEKSELLISRAAITHRSIHEHLKGVKSDGLEQSDYQGSGFGYVLLKSLTSYARLITMGNYAKFEASQHRGRNYPKFEVHTPNWRYYLERAITFLTSRPKKLPSPGFLVNLMDEFDQALAFNASHSGRVTPGTLKAADDFQKDFFDLYASMALTHTHEYFSEIVVTGRHQNNRFKSELMCFATMSDSLDTWVSFERLMATWNVLVAGGADPYGMSSSGPRACDHMLALMLSIETPKDGPLLPALLQMLTCPGGVPLCWAVQSGRFRYYKARRQPVATNFAGAASLFGSRIASFFVPIRCRKPFDKVGWWYSMVAADSQRSDAVGNLRGEYFMTDIVDILGLTLSSTMAARLKDAADLIKYVLKDYEEVQDENDLLGSIVSWYALVPRENATENDLRHLFPGNLVPENSDWETVSSSRTEADQMAEAGSKVSYETEEDTGDDWSVSMPTRQREV